MASGGHERDTTTHRVADQVDRRSEPAHERPDVADVVGLGQASSVEWSNEVPAGLEIDADSEQLFRVLMNLIRNAVQALEQGDSACVKRLTVSAERSGSSRQ